MERVVFEINKDGEVTFLEDRLMIGMVTVPGATIAILTSDELALEPVLRAVLPWAG